jgi:hypothetical protein
MSAPVANTLAQVITSDSPLKENNSKSKQAKNRTTQITEVFDALPQLEGFPLTTEQLWEYFNKATKDKNISLRKLSEKKEDKLEHSADKGPKRKNGYNLYVAEFAGILPEGISKKDRLKHIGAEWKKLSPEEQAPWQHKAQLENDSNGLQQKPKKLTYNEKLELWEEDFKEWANADPETRGPKPTRPILSTRKKKTQDITTPEEMKGVEVQE